MFFITRPIISIFKSVTVLNETGFLCSTASQEDPSLQLYDARIDRSFRPVALVRSLFKGFCNFKNSYRSRTIIISTIEHHHRTNSNMIQMGRDDNDFIWFYRSSNKASTFSESLDFFLSRTDQIRSRISR